MSAFKHTNTFISRWRTTTTALLVAGCVLATLGACSNDSAQPEPSSAIVTSSLPTPTSTVRTFTLDELPVPDPPQRPAAMDTADDAGALAFVEYFFDVYSYAYASADLSEFQKITLEECQFCINVSKKISQNNSRVTGFDIKAKSKVHNDPSGQSLWIIESTFTQIPGLHWDLENMTVQEGEVSGTELEYYFIIDYLIDWRIHAVSSERPVKMIGEK